MLWRIKNRLKARKAKQRRLRVNPFHINCMFTYFLRHTVGCFFSPVVFCCGCVRLKEVQKCTRLMTLSKILAAPQIFFIHSSVPVIELAAIYTQTQTRKLFSHRLQKPSHLSAQVYMTERSSSSSCTDRRTPSTPWTHWIIKSIVWRDCLGSSHLLQQQKPQRLSCFLLVFPRCTVSPSCRRPPCMALFGPGRVSGRGQWRSW